MSRRIRIPQLLTLVCGIGTLLALAGLSSIGYYYIEDQFALEPRYMWIHTPIMILYALFHIPIGTWIAYTTWRFSLGFKKVNTLALATYLRATFWLAILQAFFGFLLPFTVSHFLHEGNPTMVFVWFSITVVPLFVACLSVLITHTILDKPME